MESRLEELSRRVEALGVPCSVKESLPFQVQVRNAFGETEVTNAEDKKTSWFALSQPVHEKEPLKQCEAKERLVIDTHVGKRRHLRTLQQCVGMGEQTFALELCAGKSLAPNSMESEMIPVDEDPLVIMSKHFARGKVGNAPFRPGGLGEGEQVQTKQAPSSLRNVEFLSEEAINNSLLALGVSAEAERLFLKTPPGLEAYEVELASVFSDSKREPQESSTSKYLEDEDEWFAAAGESQQRPGQDSSFAEKRKRILAIADSFLEESDDSDYDHDDESSNTSSNTSDSEEGEIVNQQPERRWTDKMGVLVSKIERDPDVSPADPADPAEIDALERELESITKETAAAVSKDFFSGSKRWAVQKKNNEWAVTRPTDTSNFAQMVPDPAIQFPFELDDFQKQAVIHLERGESVFIAAHTSAGKTVVAEYAVALAMKHRTRVVYTSPIKALSNQKFRDFTKRFSAEEVGLITGDVTINGTGSCLVMTTEILRSMLYRGADLVRDIEWVIFDEVHYINDAERGVVWEEVIIMLPPHVNMIFLSATTPNTVEFSSWIGRTKKRQVYVISTDRRPVPLEHFMYASGKMFKVLNANKEFLRDNHTQACKALKNELDEDKKKARVGTGLNPASKKQQEKMKQAVTTRTPRFNEKTERSHWLNLVKDLEKKELLPVVVFSFSKKMCDQRAQALENLNMTTALEKSRIHVVFSKALARLHGSDRRLPQVLRVQELTKRGVGVHHGGLLPILKEVVEILFARGLVKVLFATETFAIGVNMPARCVVFNGLRKHDGVQFRELHPGEYTQMAGRAGRRGIDQVGTVIISCSTGKDPPTMDVLSQMLTGTATKLTSQFRLSYRMILSLLRVAELSVADMIKRSFSEFGSQRLIGGRDVVDLIARGEQRLNKLRAKLGFVCDSIARFESTRRQVQRRMVPLIKDVISGSFGKKSAGAVLSAGRVLVLSKAPSAVFDFACVLSSPKTSSKTVQVLIHAPSLGAGLSEKLEASCISVAGGEMFYADSIRVDNIVYLTGLCVDFSAQASEEEVAAEFEKVLRDLHIPLHTRCQESFPDIENAWRPNAAPLMDPVKELSVGELDFVQTWRSCLPLVQDLATLPCLSCSSFQQMLLKQQKVSDLEAKLRDARQAISDESLALYPDFTARLFVLQRMGYISRIDRAVQLKGRVACEINTCDELLLTEMILEDVFGPLSPAECAAVCSALVMEKKCEDEPILTENLEQAKVKIVSIASRLEELQKLARVEMDPSFVETSVNFGLMEAVYEWARGMPFKDICKFTSLEEGSIVRVVTRLDETCREIRNAAQIIGDAQLFKKLEKASELIKRDIIFAASLYVS